MSADDPAGTNRIAVILAAGKGTRMRSEVPKVLHAAGGRPLLAWVIAAARAAGCRRILVVVGHGAEEVERTFAGEDLTWVLQREQNGTGHALAQVEPEVSGAATLLVLSGDVPLVTGATLTALAEAAERGWGSLAVAELAEPGRLGRVIATPEGTLARIVEASDATPEELAERRVNAGLYALPAPEIFDYLRRLVPDNAQGELYLTDAPTAAAAAGERVVLVPLDDPAEAFGVNSREDLARVHRRLLDRRIGELMAAGVSVLEPARTVVEAAVEVERDTVLHPGVSLLGTTEIGPGCELHQGAWVRDSRLGAGVVVEPYTVLDGAVVEAGCRVGPFARLRPGARLDEGARVGNFVEVKEARLGPGAKAGHLAYVGDATVGAGANIGAGTVTCNYDGEEKHRTEIGEKAFVGSGTLLVAPVKVGRRAVTAAGSVITRDVADGALAVERSRQREVPGWSEKRRRKGGEET